MTVEAKGTASKQATKRPLEGIGREERDPRGWRGFNLEKSMAPLTCLNVETGRTQSTRTARSSMSEALKPSCLSVLDELTNRRAAIESLYGRALEFERLPNRRACRIADYRDDGDIRRQDLHAEYLDWFIDAGVRLRRALENIR